MAANKELLTDIFDGIIVLQAFLNQQLKHETLSQPCEAQRLNASRVLNEVLDKIRNAHPSIRPRMNTPGNMMKKPAPPPPSSAPPEVPPTLPEEDNKGEELYEEAESQPQTVVEDYIEFEPSHINGGEDDEPQQEVYEAMEAGEEQEQDVYEEPGANMGGNQQDHHQDLDNYEKPMSRNSSQLSNSSLVSKSQENSGSGAEYAETVLLRKPPPSPSSSVATDNSGFEMSTDWGNVYTLPSKGENKTKPNALKNIVIKGYLEKLGGRSRKTWQRRYCVLAGPLMYFYEKESSKAYNNCIALPSFTVELAENVTNEKKKHFGFKLSQMDTSTGKKKDYYFRANSADVRDKWISSTVKVLNSNDEVLTPKTARLSLSATLPRMPSQGPPLSIADLKRKRTSSVGDAEEGEGEREEEGELYEDMAIPEEEGEDQDEYVPISPTEGTNLEFESSEEYVDIVKQEDDIMQEQYEDTTAFQLPPPPLSPPPGPPTIFTSPSIPPKAAPPPPPPEVDTSRVYTQDKGLHLQKVFVSLWDFVAGDKDELTLHRGDLVYVNAPSDSSEWWFGELLDSEASAKLGQAGFFPRNYSTTAFEQFIC